jgi:hypothetical protein
VAIGFERAEIVFAIGVIGVAEIVIEGDGFDMMVMTRSVTDGSDGSGE